MGLLKSRKNKQFGYKPRYYNHDGDGSPFKIEQKFDKFRSTVNGRGNLKSKFVNAFDELKNPQDRNSTRIILLIIAVLLLIAFYIIDFDLSIFLPEK
jgi:hypothetical protein